jgi:hypothetical protein
MNLKNEVDLRVMIRDDFGEFMVEKRGREGSHGGKLQETTIFCIV